MNHSIITRSFLYMATATTLALTSCKKDNSVETGATTASTISSTITVAATGSESSTASTDSIYIIQPCGRGQSRDSVAAAALPAAITAYLTTNYAGYIFEKAYSVNNSGGTLDGYVAIIYFNDKPVGVLFDSTGNFLRVLEQREKGDLEGKGWHRGGRFEDRGGIKKDTVAISALPSTLTSYLATNFTTDTLIKAFTNRDSSYLVITKNNGLFATLLDANGTFVKRIELPSNHAVYQVKELVDLSVTITTYLESTYPNYTLKKAYSLLLNGTIKAYIVLIDANSTRYALEFDSAGAFVRVKTLF